MRSPFTKIHTTLFFAVAAMVLAVVYFVYFSDSKEGEQIGSSPKASPNAKIEDDHSSTNTKGIDSTEASRRSSQRKDRIAKLKDKRDKRVKPEGDTAARTDESTPTAAIGEKIQEIIELRLEASAKSVEILGDYLNDGEYVVADEAIDALGFIAKQNPALKTRVFEFLSAKALDRSYPSRNAAIVTAAMIGEEQEVLPILADLVAEGYDESRSMAVRALSFVATPASVPLLTQIVLDSFDPETRREAYYLLAKVGSPEALQVLHESIYEPDFQAAGVWALSRQSGDQTDYMISQAVINRELNSQSLAILAKSPAAPAVYGEVFQNSSVSTQDKISLLNSIAANGDKAAGSVRNGIAQALLPLMDSSDPELAQAAIQAAGKLGVREDVPEKLKPKLESDSFLVQEAALQAYAQYTSPDNYKPLKNLWYHEDEKMRRTAFFLSTPFLNESDMEDLQKASEHKDEFISKQSKTMIKYIERQQ